MRCDNYVPREVDLPEDVDIVGYRPGFELAWAKLEHALGDFESIEEARKYFVTTYLQDVSMTNRIMFAVRGDRVVGSCIAWRDERGTEEVASLHWLVVDEESRGIGIGRALSVAVMNFFACAGELPVYIHTQPWSWKAILLYRSIGFDIVSYDTFGGYTNEFATAMKVLREILPDSTHQILFSGGQATP